MSIVAYSSCFIRFIPNDKYARTRDYSERSLIELLEHSIDDYVLRGTDIENSKTRIFHIELTKRNIYKLGSSANIPDEIRDNNGTYYLHLKPEARDQFHKALKICFEELDRKPEESAGVGPGKSTAGKLSTDSMRSKTIADGNEILNNIHKLSEYIENGDVDGAAGLALKLASQPVQLKAKILDKKLDDEELQIRIKIDGIDLPNNGTNKIDVLNVYRSTTIHELQAMFQYTHGFPLADQYFFVNGHLAHAESTMNDLEVQDNALFILFINKTKQGDDNYF